VKIVYAVSSGYYSDYRIHAMFSTKKLAEQFIEKAELVHEKNCTDMDSDKAWIGGFSDSDYSIEPWTLDEEKDVEVHTRWQVRILADTGALIGEVYELHINERKHNGKATVAEKVPILKGKDAIDAESCQSAKHAMKLAVEARQAWLRRKVASVAVRLIERLDREVI